MNGLTEDMDFQIESQGVATYKVKDGEVFVFSVAMLEKLYKAAQETGKAVVFVKSRMVV
jgi:hypothetical protein